MRVLVSGGGTGGHIYPALSVVEELAARCPGAQVLYVGTARGLEARLVPAAGLPFRTLAVQGLIRKSPGQVLRGLWLLLRALREAGRIVREFAPDVVLGTGGYVSGPVLAAAAMGRRPIVIQEQNAVPGVTNRLLGRAACCVALAYPEARAWFRGARRVVVTGNPVRRAILRAERAPSRARLGLPAEATVLLAMSGSQGSATFNRALRESLPGLLQRRDLHVLWATGERHYAAVSAGLPGLGAREKGRLVVQPYVEDMPAALAAADLALCRAGALTLAELTARGVPAVLVPSPYVTHRHQERNARALAQAGAAVVIPEREFQAERLLREVAGILDRPGRLAAMAAASRAQGRPAAASRIVDEILRCREGK